MLKTCLFYFLLLIACFTATAQIKTPQQRLDSLLKVIQNHTKDDSLKTTILREVFLQYMKLKNVDKAEEYVNRTVSLAQKIGLKFTVPRSYYSLGFFYHSQANYQKAEQNYLKALEKFIEIKDLDWIAGTYLNLGALYVGIPDYAKALAANQKAIPIYVELKDDAYLASCYTNVAEIYTNLGQQINSLSYLQKALKIFLAEEQPSRGAAVVYNFIGSAYFEASDDDFRKMGIDPAKRNLISLDNLNKALKIAKELNDPTVLGTLLKDLGKVYEAMGNRELALKSYLQSKDNNDLLDNKSFSAASLLSLSSFYEKDKDYQKSISLLLEALKIGEQFKLIDIQKNAYFNLSNIEEKRGNYNQSLTYYRQYIFYKDLIFNQENEKEITRRQMQLDFAVKEKDYQLKQQFTDAELQRQLLFAKEQQQQLTLRRQQLALSDKEKTLQRLTFLTKQAELENDKSAQGYLLKQQQLKAELKDRKIGLQLAEIKLNRNVNIMLSVLAIVLFASALFVFYTQRKTTKLNKIVSKQKLELEKLGKVKDRMFSVVSHDMRSPVNSLISFIQLLENGNINQEKLTKYAANLKNTLGYTSTMMENLLNWASSQMEGYKAVKEKFDAQLCVKDVINSLQVAAQQKNVTILNEIKSGILCFADMNMTSLVLRNIISNAVKFTPNDGQIKIYTLLNDQHILFCVSDSGVGLTKDQMIIFNELDNVDTVESTLGTNKEKGTGIGLLLCKTFTSLMNGNLSVESEVGKGSIFTLALPKSA